MAFESLNEMKKLPKRFQLKKVMIYEKKVIFGHLANILLEPFPQRHAFNGSNRKVL